MTSLDTKQNMENIQKLMDIVDTARRENVRIQSVMGEVLDDKALISEVKKVYEKNGLEINEADLQAGVQALKEKRFEFLESSPGLMHKLGMAYINRQNWLPQTVKKVGLGALAIVSIGVLWQGFSAVNTMILIKDLEASIAESKYVENRNHQLQTQLSSVITGLGSYAQNSAISFEIKSTKDKLEDSKQILENSPKFSTEEPKELAKKENKDQLQKMMEVRHDSAMQAAKVLAGAKDGISVLQEQGELLSKFQNFGSIPEYLQSFINEQKDLFTSFVFNKQFNEANLAYNVVSATMTVANSISSKESSLNTLERQNEAKSDGGDIGLSQTFDLLNSAKSSLSLGNIEQATNIMTQIDKNIGSLSMSYTYKIVSREGEITLFRRKLSGNNDAKSYYVLVETVDNLGNPVSLNIYDSELQKNVEASKFGVRIPESTYEQIKLDKTDDGIVDNNVLGQKSVGKMEPVFNFPIQSGYVTRW